MSVREMRRALAAWLQAVLNASVHAFVPQQASLTRVVIRVGDITYTDSVTAVAVELDVTVPVTGAVDETLSTLSEQVFDRVRTFHTTHSVWASDPFRTTLSAPRTISSDAGDVSVVTCRATILIAAP